MIMQVSLKIISFGHGKKQQEKKMELTERHIILQPDH
jgi:hypothetical protein